MCAPVQPQPNRIPVDAGIARLLEFGQTTNPLQLLGMMAFHHLTAPVGRDDAQHQPREAWMEFALSLWLAQPFPAGPGERTPAITQECLDLLENTHQQASVYYALTSRSRAHNPDEAEMISSLRLDTLHVRGEGYRQHLELHYREIASPHDAVLRAAYHFDSRDLADAIAYAERSVQANLDRANDQRVAALQVQHEIAARELNLPQENPAVKARASSSDFAARHQAEFTRALEAFERMGAPEVFAVPPRNATDDAIFQQLALRFGDNAAFVDAIPRWRGWPLNPSRIRERPLVEHGGRYYAFHLPLLGRGALRIVENLIKRHDLGYWQTSFLRRRDDWVEATAVNLVAGMLSGCEAHQNLFYDCLDDQGRPLHTEVDGVIVFDDSLLIIEVKASTFGEDARRGGPDAIADGLRDTLDKAYAQAHRLLDLTRSRPEVCFTDAGGAERLRVRFAEFRRCFVLSVTRESLGAFATRLYLTRRLGYIQGREWPWAVSLLDLRAISEIIDRPSVFLHYLIRRMAANDAPQLAASDELDLFGYFLAGQLFFDEPDERNHADRFVPMGFDENLNDYFEARLRGDHTFPRPRMVLPERFAALLSMLEQARPRHFCTACLDMLQYSGEFYTQVHENVPQIEVAFVERNACRQVTLGNDRNESLPIVVLACCRVGSVQETQVLAQVQMNKQRRFPRHRATVVLWEPPMAANRCRIHLL